MTPSSRQRRPDPQIAWPLKVLAGVAVAAAAFAAFDAAGTDDDVVREAKEMVERTGSRRVGPADPDWAFGAFPDSYEITARVAVTGSQSTEVVKVVAPFASRLEVHAGRDTSGTPSSVREVGFGILANQGSGELTVTQVPPALSAARPAAAILEAEGHGTVVRKEVREVAGRRCQVWRTSDEQGATTYLPPTGEDYIDVCVDAAGLLLEEWQVSKGTPVRQRVAVRVREGDVTEAELQRLPREITLPTTKGGGSVIATEATARPVGPFLEIPAPPAGFTHRGRFTVVPPSSGLVEGGERGRVSAATTDVYERGPDAIVVERGGVLDLSDPWTPDDRLADVDLGPTIGTGELLAGTSGAEVRALLGQGRYLRISGSATQADLVALARSLVKVEDGSGIGFSDG